MTAAQVEAEHLFPVLYPQPVVLTYIDVVGSSVEGQAAHVRVIAVDVAEMHPIEKVDVAVCRDGHSPVGELQDVLYLVVAKTIHDT